MSAAASPALATVPRHEYVRALVGLELPPLVLRAALWLSEAATWSTGIVGSFLSGRRLAYVLGVSVREVRRAVAALRARSLLAVVERGPLGEPRYALALPGRVPAQVGGAELDEPQEAPPAPAAPAREDPPPSTFVGRMWRSVVNAISGIAPEPGEALPLLARDMRLAYLDGYAPEVERRDEPEHDVATPPAELEGLFSPRHVGPLYASREAAAAEKARADTEAAAERWRRRQDREAAREDGPGDAAPHRAAVLAYRRAFRDAYGESPWVGDEMDHQIAQAMLRHFGLDGTLNLIRDAFEARPKRRPSWDSIAAASGALDGDRRFRWILRAERGGSS